MDFSTELFDDDDFGFHCKRFIRNPPPPPPPSHNNVIVLDFDEDSTERHSNSKMNHKNINDEYDRKPASTRISKGKAVTFETELEWHTFEHSTNTHSLTPISPYTPPDHQQYRHNSQPLPSRSFTNINTLSPELTGPQTAISPLSKPTTPPPKRNDSYRAATSPITTHSYTVKVATPPSTVPISEYHTLIKADLPNQERKRQLALMLLLKELDTQTSTRKIYGGSDKQAVLATITRQNNLQRVLQQVIKKLDNRDDNPFAKQHKGASVFVYSTPNPANERRMTKMKNYKQLCASLEKEVKYLDVVRTTIFEYNAQQNDFEAEEPINYGSCLDYIDTMDEDQQVFIKNYQQWKDDINQQAFENGGDYDSIPISSTTIKTPTLQDLMLRKSKLVTELRHQLNIANERQKKAGEKGDWILAKIAAKLKQETLTFASVSHDHHPSSSSSDQPSSSTSHLDTTDNTTLWKKRRILGLSDDVEMYTKPNFEFFQTMSKLK